MKNVLRTAVASLAIASVAVSAPAFAATETVDAHAEIISSLDITLDADRNSLDFGLIAEGGGGQLQLLPNGSEDCGPGLVCNGPFETPLFTLDGEAGALVNISLQNTTIELTDGTNTMSVELDLGQSTATLDNTTGEATFEVGGTLTVAADQPVGVYLDQDDFVVVAAYN